ncbi:MAG: PilZ domain-containing protein [Myxococcaceae bacterium]
MVGFDPLQRDGDSIHPATVKDEVRSISVQYPSRRTFLTASRAEGSSLMLFVPTAEEVRPGELVRLEIQVGSFDRRFELVGRAGSPTAVRMGLVREPGFGFSIEGAFKRDAAEMIALCAGRTPSLGTAACQRYAADIRCTVQDGSRRLLARVSDLSAGGMFVATQTPGKLAPGTMVEVTFEPRLFGLGGTRVDAKVVWRGKKRGLSGFGARFIENGPGLQRVFRKYLERRISLQDASRNVDAG